MARDYGNYNVPKTLQPAFEASTRREAAAADISRDMNAIEADIAAVSRSANDQATLDTIAAKYGEEGGMSQDGLMLLLKSKLDRTSRAWAFVMQMIEKADQEIRQLIRTIGNN